MNPLPTPTLQDLRWKFLQSASNGTPFPSQTVTVATLQELESAAADMLQTQKALRENNKDVVLKGVQGKSVTLSYNGHILRVTLAKTPKHTQTTATSREAYHSTDFSTQEGKVAQIIMAKTGEDITRAEIAYILDIQEGRVSGRVNSLLKKYRDGGFWYGEKEYRLVLTVPRLSRCPGASDKLNEALRFERVLPEIGIQGTMF